MILNLQELIKKSKDTTTYSLNYLKNLIKNNNFLYFVYEKIKIAVISFVNYIKSIPLRIQNFFWYIREWWNNGKTFSHQLEKENHWKRTTEFLYDKILQEKLAIIHDLTQEVFELRTKISDQNNLILRLQDKISQPETLTPQQQLSAANSEISKLDQQLKDITVLEASIEEFSRENYRLNEMNKHLRYQVDAYGSEDINTIRLNENHSDEIASFQENMEKIRATHRRAIAELNALLQAEKLTIQQSHDGILTTINNQLEQEIHAKGAAQEQLRRLETEQRDHGRAIAEINDRLQQEIREKAILQTQSQELTASKNILELELQRLRDNGDHLNQPEGIDELLEQKRLLEEEVARLQAEMQNNINSHNMTQEGIQQELAAKEAEVILLKRQKSAIEAEVNALQQNYTRATQTNNHLRGVNGTMQNELTRKDAEIASLSDDKTTLEEQIQAFTSSKENLKLQIEEQKIKIIKNNLLLLKDVIEEMIQESGKGDKWKNIQGIIDSKEFRNFLNNFNLTSKITIIQAQQQIKGLRNVVDSLKIAISERFQDSKDKNEKKINNFNRMIRLLKIIYDQLPAPDSNTKPLSTPPNTPNTSRRLNQASQWLRDRYSSLHRGGTSFSRETATRTSSVDWRTQANHLASRPSSSTKPSKNERAI